MRFIYFTCLLCFFLIHPFSDCFAQSQKPLQTATLTVAAAADLRFVLPEIVSPFQTLNPDVKVEVIYGASGKFYEQILRKAPFDIFLSADKEYPFLLYTKGYAAEEPFQYAEGKLVLWMRKGLFGERKDWKELLTNKKVSKIALANPQHAPYGKIAQTALENAGLWEKLNSKFVYGENVIQAFQFAEGKNAELAFIPLAIALSPKARNEGDYVEIPHSFYPKILQYGIIVKKAANLSIAKKFKDYLLSEESQKTLKKYGFCP
ncbi:molybdenum ABC transporter substrate-binding protein [Methylacidiphilum kamchatkense Kam1]|uniref:Molybdate transport system substrate-binding protein n=1 Tax=Methylacidiphilum kamchatkense Kam1 TaxID=1202785 RepID=A0A0C1V3T1_9BACT|nr:molybdenum ABC transporter substrate-binding protein [Methylacidiphilum kamchatkense Kam1]QDQ42240.1 molybdate transport system substrate-binding protein [Methylacidiphilum kamchatkense Kam1]